MDNLDPYVLLQSKQAGDCIKDRVKQGTNRSHTIFGFKTYCALVKKVWNRSGDDDPYADIVLCEIDRRIYNSLEAFDKVYRTLDEKLHIQAINHIESILAGGNSKQRYFSSGAFLKHPVKIDLNSAIPYIHLGGALLSAYDDIIRKIVISRSLKLVKGSEADQLHKNCRTSIRSVFSAPAIYKDTGIARDDIIHQSIEGLSAIERCGPIPATILKRELSPQFSPK